MIDLQGNHTFTNNAIEKHLGYSREEFLSTPFLQLVHIDDAEQIRSSMPELIREKKGWHNWTLRWKSKSGEFVYFASSAVPTFDENGELVGFRGIDRELTALNSEIAKFKEFRDYWESAFEHMADIVIIADDQGRIKFANKHARGRESISLVGKSVFEFVMPRYEHVLRQSFAAIVEGKSSSSFETRVRLPDGEEAVFDNRLSPVVVNGQTQDVLFHSTNITELRRVDADLRHLNKRLRMIMQSAATHMFVVDRFGKIQYVNHVADGYTVQDVIGRSVFDFLKEKSIRLYRAALQKVIETLEPQRIEFEDKLGEWFEVTINPLGERNVHEAVVVGQNVTKRRKTARQLLLHRERAQSLMHSSRDFILCIEGEVDTRTYKSHEELYNQLLESFVVVETNAEVNQVLLSNSLDSPDGTPLKQLCEAYPRVATLIKTLADRDLSVKGALVNFMDENEVTYWEVFANTVAHKHKVHRIWITGRNQTSSIEDRNQIEEHKRQIGLIFDLSPVGISFADKSGHFLRVNPAFSRLLGYSMDEITTMSYKDITDTEHVDESVEQMKQLIDGEIEKVSMNKRYVCKDGSTLWARLFVTAARDKEGAFAGSVAVVQDISHELEEEQLRQENKRELERMVDLRTKELQVANEELQKFSYSVSHDLRAPLRAISGFTSLFMEDYGEALNDEGRHFLNQVSHAATQMRELIDSLLELSRLSAREIEWRDVDISELCEHIVSDLQTAPEYKHVEFSVQSDIHVRGDANLLTSAFTNLLENAAKYSHKKPTAAVRVEAENVMSEEVCVCVIDNGVGFNERYKDRIFTAFQRLHTEEEFDGTGIGLATVQRVVHRLGGTVDAFSTVGEGAKFCITLQRA